VSGDRWTTITITTTFILPLLLILPLPPPTTHHVDGPHVPGGLDNALGRLLDEAAGQKGLPLAGRQVREAEVHQAGLARRDGYASEGQPTAGGLWSGPARGLSSLVEPGSLHLTITSSARPGFEAATVMLTGVRALTTPTCSEVMCRPGLRIKACRAGGCGSCPGHRGGHADCQ
jgi:hypothetical protein